MQVYFITYVYYLNLDIFILISVLNVNCLVFRVTWVITNNISKRLLLRTLSQQQ